MAPDKIYMPNELFSEGWQRHIEGQDTEYIRKDALLEWAERELRTAELTAFDEFGKGELRTWWEIVEKIKSL